jgi:hypothetical protein
MASCEVRIVSSWGKSTRSRLAICSGLHDLAQRRSLRRPCRRPIHRTSGPGTVVPSGAVIRPASRSCTYTRKCVVLAGQPVRDRLPEPQPMLTPRHRRPARRPHRRPSCRRRSPTPWSSHPHPRCSGCCDDQLNPPTYGLCRVKEAQAPRAPSVAHALHHIMAAQRRRRRKAKWCCVRCHEASSLANLWQLRTDRPPRTRQAPYWVVRAVFKMST